MAKLIGRLLFWFLVVFALIHGCACLVIAFQTIEDTSIRVGLAITGAFNVYCLFILFRVFTHLPTGVADDKVETDGDSLP